MEALKNPLYVTNPTIHFMFWTIATFHPETANSGSWIQFSRDGTNNTWQTGMSSNSSYVIRASDSTNSLSVNPNGSAVLSDSLTQNPDASLKYDVENLGLIGCMYMLET